MNPEKPAMDGSRSGPKLSVVMSVYNGGRFLAQSIESVLEQTFAGFEFIIIDDGSTDDTWAVIEKYASRDARIRPVRNDTNIGLTRSLNKGLALARGGYVARQDADDISIGGRFLKQIRFLDGNPSVVMVSGGLERIDAEGRRIDRTRRVGDPALVAWFLVFYNHVCGHGSVMFRREAVIGLGGYSEEFRYSQDYELWTRLAEDGDIVILPDTLLIWRNHEGNISSRNGAGQRSLGLECSRRTVERLTGMRLCDRRLENLRDIMHGRRVANGSLGEVGSDLRRIFAAFRKKSPAGKRHPGEMRRIKELCAERLLHGVKEMSLSRPTGAEILLLCNVAYMRPARLAGFIMARVKKLPGRAGRGLARILSGGR